MSDVKAVVVRLHDGELSEQQIADLNYQSMTSLESLLAIGTPVAGGELDVVGMRARDIRSIFTSIWHYSGDIESSGNYETELLVRQSDALADLAAAQAENARLRDHLEAVRSYLKEAPSVISRRGALVVIEEALKGPAS